MPGYAGFDTSEFPGLDEMAWLKHNTNLTWCGLYLGPAPSHGSTSWMGRRTALQAAGTFIYLDLENGPPFQSPQTDYVKAWAAAVAGGHFQVGVYCSHLFAADVQTLLPAARVWTIKVATVQEHPFPGCNFPDLHPAGSGYPASAVWQLGQNCRLSMVGAPKIAPLVDLDTAAMPDPGSP
jgi:hypothetical protein